ncbi:WRKY domain [Dillenia turbinata]|uniref:WRKY domain n=1 Tax=Dillenia turbinata TaxID=194707 RepID=A0AAN8VM75_9MAGN
MENVSNLEQKILISELTHGRALAKQLQIHLSMPSSSREARESLVQKILASYEKALSMLKYNGSLAATTTITEPVTAPIGNALASESPSSLSASPHSEDSDRDFKEHEIKDASRKRKSTPRWTKQVSVSPGSGLEQSLDDGYVWRKYGQKDILGAKYPRGYYRCTHRNVQGCLATKQVQRSGDDPTIFEITYRGWHTCNQAPDQLPPNSLPQEKPGQPQDPINLQNQNQIQPQEQQPQDLLFNFRNGLKVKTENLETNAQTFPNSFFFHSSSNTKDETNVFVSNLQGNNFMGHFSPSYLSPATWGSNIFSLEANHNFQGPESDLDEIVSAGTSVSNSPIVDLEYPFGTFDPGFTFDISGFIS